MNWGSVLVILIVSINGWNLQYIFVCMLIQIIFINVIGILLLNGRQKTNFDLVKILNIIIIRKSYDVYSIITNGIKISL